jgi:hypothetical protein
MQSYGASALASYVLLRVSEFTTTKQRTYIAKNTLLRSDIKITKNTIKINLKTAKNDPYHRGAIINIASNSSNICPHAAIKAYLKIRGKAMDHYSNTPMAHTSLQEKFNTFIHIRDTMSSNIHNTMQCR